MGRVGGREGGKSWFGLILTPWEKIEEEEEEEEEEEAGGCLALRMAGLSRGVELEVSIVRYFRKRRW